MAARRLRLLSTIGPVEAGIVPALLAAYAADSGPVETALTAAGWGKALDLARHGGFDAVLAHAPALPPVAAGVATRLTHPPARRWSTTPSRRPAGAARTAPAGSPRWRPWPGRRA